VRAKLLRRQVRVEQQFLNCFPIKCLGRAALCCKPLLQALNLVDAGDSAAGGRSELSIDLGPSSLSNPACRFGEWAIDAETTVVNHAAQEPSRLLRWR